MKKSSWIVLMSFMAPFFAAAGPNDGGGGDAVRLDVVAVRDYDYHNCEKFSQLKAAGIRCTDLKPKMDEVGTKPDRLRIEQTVDLGDGNLRDGRNRPNIPDITYSRTRWLESQADTMRKIGIELHENLGLMGIEGTDDYHVSSKVVNELRANKSVETSASIDPAASRCKLEFDVPSLPSELGGRLSYTVVDENGGWITPLEASSLEDVTKQFRALKDSGVCNPDLSCKLEYRSQSLSAKENRYSYEVAHADGTSGWVTFISASSTHELAAQFKALVSSGICHSRNVKSACELDYYGEKIGGGIEILFHNVTGANGKPVTQLSSQSTQELAKKFKFAAASGLCGN